MPKNTDNLFCAANENKVLFVPIKLVRFLRKQQEYKSGHF